MASQQELSLEDILKLLREKTVWVEHKIVLIKNRPSAGVNIDFYAGIGNLLYTFNSDGILYNIKFLGGDGGFKTIVRYVLDSSLVLSESAIFEFIIKGKDKERIFFHTPIPSVFQETEYFVPMRFYKGEKLYAKIYNYSPTNTNTVINFLFQELGAGGTADFIMELSYG